MSLASVVIPTFNSESTIQDCLASVRRSCRAAPFPTEIIVVDAGSTDRTTEIAAQYASKVVMGVPGRINRNAGIRRASGEVICFTDSDCTVPENWVTLLVTTLRALHHGDSRIVGVGGPNYPASRTAIAEVLRSPLVGFRARNVACWQTPREVTHNPPVNAAYLRSALDEVGGFVEELGYPEDLDLDARLRQCGYRLFYSPAVAVSHAHRHTVEGFIAQMRDFGRKRIRLNRRYPCERHWWHYGPVILHLMLLVPLPFGIVPVMMAGLNALIGRNWRLLPLTLQFYDAYGRGELEALLEG